MEVSPKRLSRYGLTFNSEKSRLMEIERYAKANAQRRGRNPLR